jgi:catechol 2,3-dioxygenase-like lactoylglutathione lyase family enzyme
MSHPTDLSSNGTAESAGVHSLDHFGLLVPNLAIAATFFQAFGLDVREKDNALGLYTYGSSHRWGVIRQGERKALQYVSFGIFEKDISAFRSRVGALGVPLVDPPNGVSSKNGFWFRDPSGTLLELRPVAKSSPDVQSPSGVPHTLPGLRGARGRAQVKKVQPVRLAHILIFSCDVLRDIKFYESVLGLRLSDRAGGDIAFMHGKYGSDHHMIAMAKSHKSGLHHTSWTVNTVDEVGLGAMQMESAGYRNGWGFGRHVLGSNYFHYVEDPWNSYSEYSFGIDYIPGNQVWPTAVHAPEDAFYVWGPDPPHGFNLNHES